uniref:Uncharacterized protein n=1 Tax=Oryza nivara TaxID=4536 RepID=A0A0E0J0Z8_ORYNI
MRFMEAYDGNRESIETLSIPTDSSLVRSSILHQLMFSKYKQAAPLHPDIEEFRCSDVVNPAA